MENGNVIDVTSISEPNPDWFYCCPCGTILTLENPPKKRIKVKETENYPPTFESLCPKCGQCIPMYMVAAMTRPSTHREFIKASWQRSRHE